ncbi:hypothetical protein [Pseudofrankia sp. BMG5.36]|uniref:hypothetical protein n=1 Tax=Pseudofrankia sp. BMG5.36 TaxID=1834512 RepID=UPI000A948CCA|nr:hypothetical protein [Pseudofrankia sp. BMG5.36]
MSSNPGDPQQAGQPAGWNWPPTALGPADRPVEGPPPPPIHPPVVGVAAPAPGPAAGPPIAPWHTTAPVIAGPPPPPPPARPPAPPAGVAPWGGGGAAAPVPAHWAQVRGRVVFDSAWCALREGRTSGFSMIGSRQLLLTDLPAVYVHDTGGFGAAVLSTLEPAFDPVATVELHEGSTRLAVDVAFPDGRTYQAATVTPLPPELRAALTGLFGRLLPDAWSTAFVSPCAMSVTPHYEQDPGADATLKAAAPPVAVAPPPADAATGGLSAATVRGAAAKVAAAARGASASEGQAGTPSAPDGELTTYVVVKDGRLELRSRGQTIIDWPLNRVAVEPAGPTSAAVRGGAVLDGRFLTGVTLHLATPEVLAAFLATAHAERREAEPAAIGTSAPVWASGLGGDAARGRADCVLGDTVLELQPRESVTALTRFELTDSRLRVAGSAQRFVIFDPEHGPVVVESDSEAFGQRVGAHPGVRSAAERTLAAGPYPAELADGGPVACAVAAGALRVKGPGADLRVPFPEILSVEGTADAARASLRVAAAGADVTVVGQLELVRALHTDIVAGNYATEDPRHLPDMLRAAAGLEDDYFLYTIFGPFYELHAALLGDAAAGDLAVPVTLPADDEGQLRTAAALSEGLDELRRHLDQVGSVLPAFIRHRDALLLAPATGGRAEPEWLKAQESRLRAALAPAQRAAAETGALSAQVQRLMDLDPSALPKANYAGAAVALGAALLNPVFLVSGATQAFSQYNQRAQRSALMSAQAVSGWASALDRWNTLVTATLPVLGYVLTENLFALRWETARRLAEELRHAAPAARGAAMGGVARRLARLDVLRRYPAGTGIRLTRGEIAHHLRAARDSVSTPRFVDF